MGDKLPRCVIEISIDTIFTQCQKALVRSKLWDPAVQIERSALPTVGEIMTTITAGEFDGAAYDAAYPERLRQTIYCSNPPRLRDSWSWTCWCVPPRSPSCGVGSR